jgi:hypothetical protein
MHRDCLESFKALLPARDRAKIEATMQDMFCTLESLSIPSVRFNPNEGRHDGHLVQVFKSNQARVYGVSGSILGKRAFFATNVAIKKSRKADPGDLLKAGRLAATICAHVGGARV